MYNLKKILATILAALALVFTGKTAFADTTGSITINNASQGQTYTIYKLFDATVDGNGAIAYTVPAGKTFAGNDYFTVDASGNVLAKEGVTNDTAKTADFQKWAKEFGTKQGETVTASSNTVTFSGVPFGYYYIESSLGGVLTVDSTNPNATVIDKNETQPDIPDPTNGGGKQILVNGKTVKETTAKVGDTINYQITFNATNFVTKNGETSQIINYTIVDTPTNLTLNKDVTVKVGDKTVEVTPTIAADGKMTIKLPWVNESNSSIYNSPSTVVITYSGVVTKAAADAPATNSATITYDTKDTTDNPVDPNHPDTPTTVTTYKFNLQKVDGSNNQLENAEFKLYAKDGTEIPVVKEGDHYRVAEANETGVAIVAGKVDIKGLKGDTTYSLEEIKAPAGYNRLTEKKDVAVTKDGAAVAKIVNNKGTALPSTGSIGTKMFYAVGSVMLVVAFVYMISKRRVNNMN